jgi:hypothetical protein
LWSVLQHGTSEALKGIAIVATGIPAYLAFRRRAQSPLSGSRESQEKSIQ